METHINSADKADALDREFHVRLFDISGNRILKIFSNVIHLLFRRQYCGKFLNPKAKQDSIREHKELLGAIMAEDVAGASEIIRKHISRT